LKQIWLLKVSKTQSLILWQVAKNLTNRKVTEIHTNINDYYYSIYILFLIQIVSYMQWESQCITGTQICHMEAGCEMLSLLLMQTARNSGSQMRMSQTSCTNIWTRPCFELGLQVLRTNWNTNLRWQQTALAKDVLYAICLCKLWNFIKCVVYEDRCTYTPKDVTMHSPKNKGFLDHYTQKYWRTSYWMFKNIYPRSMYSKKHCLVLKVQNIVLHSLLTLANEPQ
jgi:hypothetical protein